MATPKFTMTQDSITVVIAGDTHSIKKGDPDFDAVRKAVYDEDWDAIPPLCSKGRLVEGWLSSLGEGYTLRDNVVWFHDEQLPPRLNDRIIKMAQKGESPQSLANFWRLLQGNPSNRSVNQLYSFLEHNHIPIDEDGYILAYKAVSPDFKDLHSGTVDNSVGQEPSMPRNRISDDPRNACDVGFHVGALSYVQSYGRSNGKIVICRVHPADVVSVPYDHDATKMRVCRYKVIGLYAVELPDTTYSEDWEDDEWDEDEETEDTVDPDEEEEEVVHWLNFNDLSLEDLENQSLSDLRKYARHVLNIIGASKIPGGKAALLDRIRRVREGT